MATNNESRRLALRSTSDRAGPYGAWWPHSRLLNQELADLFELWPAGSGRISRVLYSPPDWDDHPRAVAVPGRKVKTGSFPRDDTRQLVLTMHDGRRLAIRVIAPDTAAERAATLLVDASRPRVSAGKARAVPAADELDAGRCVWDNEGGHS